MCCDCGAKSNTQTLINSCRPPLKELCAAALKQMKQLGSNGCNPQTNMHIAKRRTHKNKTPAAQRRRHVTCWQKNSKAGDHIESWARTHGEHTCLLTTHMYMLTFLVGHSNWKTQSPSCLYGCLWHRCTTAYTWWTVWDLNARFGLLL